MKIKIRRYTAEDCKKITELFFETVHHSNCRHYSKEQLDVWANGQPDLAQWNASLMKNYSLVAVRKKQVVGFGDISQDGYLDRLYVDKNFQNQKIATCLCDALEVWAQEQGVTTIETHASITAKTFFEQRGYNMKKQQQVCRKGVLLTNFVMEKQIFFKKQINI